MRALPTLGLILCVMTAACANDPKDQSYGTCESDSECGGDTCTRSGECLATQDVVPTFSVTWLINGLPPTADSCAKYPDLQLVFTSADAKEPELRFHGIHCADGRVTLDRVPVHLFFQMALGVDGIREADAYPNPFWDRQTFNGRAPQSEPVFVIDPF